MSGSPPQPLTVDYAGSRVARVVACAPACRPPSRNDRSACRAPLPARRARGLVEQRRRGAPSCGTKRGDVVAAGPASRRARRTLAARDPGAGRWAWTIGPGQRGRVALRGRCTRVDARPSRTSTAGRRRRSRRSACRHRQRLERRQRRALPQRRKHAEVERGQRRARRPARSRGSANRSPRPSACACAFEAGAQRALADEHEPGLRPLAAMTSRAASTRTRCPSSRAAASPCRQRTRPGASAELVPRARAISAGAADRLNSSSGTPQDRRPSLSLGRHLRAPRSRSPRCSSRPRSRCRCAAPAAGRRPAGTTACRSGWRARAGSSAGRAITPGEPPERRRAVAVQVQDVDLLAIDHLQQRRSASPDRTSTRCR